MATTYHDSQDAVKNNEVLIVAYGSDMHYPDGRSSLHKTFNHSCTQHALPICEHVMSRLFEATMTITRRATRGSSRTFCSGSSRITT